MARKLQEAVLRDPRERFVELANKRVTQAIRQIRLVGNLANRRDYRSTDTDSKKIIRALHQEVNVLKARFSGDDDSNGSIFSL